MFSVYLIAVLVAKLGDGGESHHGFTICDSSSSLNDDQSWFQCLTNPVFEKNAFDMIVYANNPRILCSVADQDPVSWVHPDPDPGKNRIRIRILSAQTAPF